MGGSLQCDLSFATFNIEGNLIKLNREPKSIYMIEEDVEENMTNFVDTNINAFKAEVLTLKKSKHKSRMEIEVDTKIDKVIYGLFF